MNTPLEFLEEEIAALLSSGLAECSMKERLILVSHTPPSNTKLDLAFIGEHIGSVGVRRFVEEKKPLAARARIFAVMFMRLVELTRLMEPLF